MKKFFEITSTKIVITLGALGFVVGAYIDALNIGADIRQLGSILIVATIVRVWCIKPACTPQDEIFAAAYQQGLDQGWTQGHREARPVVVPLRATADLHSAS